tara:strand:+ start:4637 stop:5068 length:432 start_codon:yes stop_codon:yes gene_type:complete
MKEKKMAKTGNFNHSSTNTTTVTGIAATYAVGRVHKHTLLATDPLSSAKYVNKIEGIYVRINTISGGATSLTCQGSFDAAGDDIWFPNTEGELAIGVTTATKGAAVFEFKLPVHIEVGSDVYLFFKMGTGSCVVDKTTITWSE